MHKIERLLEIYRILDTNSPEEIIFLSNKDPFQFLISVILSAQTTDKMVNIVTKDLFSRYPTKLELSKADYDEVCTLIKSTGYYRNKAKNIIKCSQALIGKQIPDDISELIKLPGVGRKTANCVVGEVYSKDAVIVDTHVKRVLNRLEIVKEKDPTKIEMQVRSLLDKKYLYRFSMIINLHGRNFCFARKPNCENCKISHLCPSKDEYNLNLSK